jgi:hypothetical protein
MHETIPHTAGATAAARRLLCDACWALPGKPCTFAAPAGDHLQRYLTAQQLGLISLPELKAIVARLTVVARHVVIPELAA